MPRKNLVVARVGDDSLHREWLSGATRSFDLVLSCYGQNPGKWRGDADVHEVRPGLKWPVLHEFVTENRAMVDSYEAVWFPDDDLSIDTPGIDAAFALAAEADLALSQPALTHGSPFSIGITVGVDGLLLRWTTFVEVMAPLFSRNALRFCAPTFRESVSGWGLDNVWSMLLEREGLTLGVFDGIRMRHTREVGSGSLYSRLTESPHDEARRVCEKFGAEYPLVCRTLAAVDLDGRPVSSADLARVLLERSDARVHQGWHLRQYVQPTIEALLTGSV